ncbi:MAG: Asp-tRNA(Asn)/Glu-tRNA(Gln) amidotransferase subunit GatA [Azospirillum sp.]|nr:Asp-tRNA(Asn)/Glu-tRNA(Gln) amidotransferase subunit GatA [Azospirillum sp.]
MTTLTDLTLAQLRDGLHRRSFSAREAATAFLERMATIRRLNAFTTETPERALADAARADANLAAGTAGRLEGLPLAVKDNYCTKGVRTTASSNILANFIPPYESAVTARAWQAGAVLVGKTNMDEFAMGSSTLTSAFGPTLNPFKAKDDPRDRVPGGSSGGSAAAVAARAAPAALGSDTGGSIRQPASFCGLVGLKPTYGRCSRRGIIAYASSLDQAGPLARTVRDAAILLGAIAGYDPGDSTSVDLPVPDYEAALGRSVKGLRVGIPREYRLDGLRPDVVSLWDRGAQALRDAGVEVVEVSLPLSKYALAAYYIIAMAEASSNLARYDGVRFGRRDDGANLNELYETTRAAGFGAEVKRRILLGTFALSAGYYDAYYKKAQQVRRLIADDFGRALTQVDALLFPTSPIPAFPVGDDGFADDPIAMYLIDVFTVTVNLAGLPGLSLPFGSSVEGLPLGLQLVGRAFDEETVLRLAAAMTG